MMSAKTDGVSQSAHQTIHDHLRRMLRGAVQAAMRSQVKGAVGSMGCRASAALDALLAAHPVDRVGRCRSCRRPGALLGRRRRRCLIYLIVRYWLRQPDEVLRSHLASETSLSASALTPRTDLGSTQPLQRFPRAGRPDPRTGRSLLVIAALA
jgi:hypothetical protein